MFGFSLIFKVIVKSLLVGGSLQVPQFRPSVCICLTSLNNTALPSDCRSTHFAIFLRPLGLSVLCCSFICSSLVASSETRDLSFELGFDCARSKQSRTAMSLAAIFSLWSQILFEFCVRMLGINISLMRDTKEFTDAISLIGFSLLMRIWTLLKG